MYHGSLEVPNEFAETEQQERAAIVEERCRTEPYKSRRIRVTVDVSSDAVELMIRDEGPGFNFRERFGSPGTGAETLEIAAGTRGLVLMHMFMDELLDAWATSYCFVVNRLPSPSMTLPQYL